MYRNTSRVPMRDSRTGQQLESWSVSMNALEAASAHLSQKRRRSGLSRERLQTGGIHGCEVT